MCGIWQAETIHCRLQLWTQTIRELVAPYRVMCGLLQVICSLGRPIQSDVRSCQGDVRYSYAHKFVMCGDVRFSSTPLVLGGECRSASAALLIHCLGADNAKNLSRMRSPCARPI